MSGPENQGNGGGEPRSEIDAARITGDVVQARDVSGGVHFHPAPEGSQGPRVIPHQLPADVSSFVSRNSELRALTRLAPAGGTRGTATVVVITGSAGVGKTALAVHWGHRVRERFPDGDLYVNLRGYDDSPPVAADVVLDRFLRDLGVEPQSVPAETDERAALFRSLITGRRILIVLDNAAGTGQVRPLIPGGPGPLVVITSRSQLSGLAIRDGARGVRLDVFAESDAVVLLRRVTRTGGRRDAPDDLAELARLCARLPLALRIAAEHAISRPMMQLAELIADLRDDSLLWDALSVDQGPHSETVRTVFTWSYRDLLPEAARMFRALGLHPGPDISLEAAAAAVGVPARTARRTLDILLGAFLVQSARPHRYQLHDLLRAYALDQARATDTEAERREALDRMLRWYIVSAARARSSMLPDDGFTIDVPPPDGPELLAFENAAGAFEWFDTERANLVAAARSALDAGLGRRAWELAMALAPIHASYLTFDDWAALSAIAVTAAEEAADPTMLAEALNERGRYFFWRRELDEAGAIHTRALAIREETGDQRGVRQSLNALGLISLRTRRLDEASAYFADIAERARRDGDRHWDGLGRMNQAEAHLEAGNVVLGLQTVTPLPEYFTDLHDPFDEGNALRLLSWAHRLSGNLPGALAAIDAALRIAEDLSNRQLEAWWLIEAARVHLALGDTGEAMRCCRMAASLERQIGDHSREATALDCAGEVLAAMGNAADSAAFHQQAARMHRRLGDGWQEALATAHLADREHALGQADASREHLAEALALLRQFPDDRAARLRADIQARVLCPARVHRVVEHLHIGVQLCFQRVGDRLGELQQDGAGIPLADQPGRDVSRFAGCAGGVALAEGVAHDACLSVVDDGCRRLMAVASAVSCLISMADQTTLPPSADGYQPHRDDRVSTRSRPLPCSASGSASAPRGSGGAGLGSHTLATRPEPVSSSRSATWPSATPASPEPREPCDRVHDAVQPADWPREPCSTAFVTNSETTVSASSASSPRPHVPSRARTCRRASPGARPSAA